MKIARDILSRQFFSWFFAVYLLNFSIDTTDSRPDHVPEDLLFNDIESIVEFAVEVVFGLDNLIREHDEQDGNKSRPLSHHSFLPGLSNPRATAPICHSDEVVQLFGKPTASFVENCPDVVSPPPKFPFTGRVG